MEALKKKHSQKCNYCGKFCDGGIITRIKYHLGKVPKSNVLQCKKDPSHEELIKLLTKSIDAKIKKAKEMETDI